MNDGHPFFTLSVTPDGLFANDYEELGVKMIFTRDVTEANKIAEVKTDAAPDEFLGEWVPAYIVGLDEMIISPSDYGVVFPIIVIGNEAISFVQEGELNTITEVLYNQFQLDGIFQYGKLTYTYTNGTLILRIPEDKPTSEGTLEPGIVEMLADGMIRITLNTPVKDYVIYYSPVGLE